MQTLRKRTSPCKYKNDPSRFFGEGITFKAKLIGILEVNEARGDKMCQDALNDLKTAIRVAGEHKQRITISISIDGLKLRDEKTGDCLYHHPVHKISFIAQDMSDSRAFGYIFGSPDIGHRFFGIKTDKTASQVVISMRDLFQVVFELKKKEIESAKHQSEQHHIKYGNTGYLDSFHFTKDESEGDKGKGKYSQLLKSRCLTSKSGESGLSEYKGPTSEAIADLLDLEHELNSIQQGINQMDKITPSDPFGPLSKGEAYVDLFDDSFPSKTEKSPEEKVSSMTENSLKSQTTLHHQEETSDNEKHSSFFGSTNKSHFFPQLSPGLGKTKLDDSRWFDQETESLFNETVNVNNAEPTSSPIALNTSGPEPDQFQVEGKKSPVKTDLFTELDPLGTGRVRPYVDKKDFFQELKNPPKKVLKEMITDTSITELTSVYFPAHFKEEKNSPNVKSESAQAGDCIPGFKNESLSSKYTKADPFEDGDPFEKTDPFQEESFSTSVGFPLAFGSKGSVDEVFEDKMSWKFEKSPSRDMREEKPSKSSPTNLFLFSSSSLRVSLPPEKSDGPISISTITSKLKSSPNSPEDSKIVRRRCYQTLKQSTVEGSEESPVHEEPFVSTKLTNIGVKGDGERRSPYKDKFQSIQSPPSSRRDKQNSKIYSSVEVLDATTPDPPPRAKTALFSIKPPPLPPKKISQSIIKPPARPPSSEETATHYDYLEKKESSCNSCYPKDELKCVKLKKQLFSGKESPLPSELRKPNSNSNFPVLPPPPHRKTSSECGKTNSAKKVDGKSRTSETPGSILNLKLNQLDNTGLENLAITLGIPSENIYSMTLQELTKMLADKYLSSREGKQEEKQIESFEADFDANFGKPETNNSNPPLPSYDKYAVFKELMESEIKASEPLQKIKHIKIDKELSLIKDDKYVSETSGQEEDRYAALRQLSLNEQKSGNFSDDDESETKTEVCGGSQPSLSPPKESSSTTINNLDLVTGNSDSKLKLQSSDSRGDNIETSGERTSRSPTTEQSNPEGMQFSSDSQLFPLVDQFSDDKKPISPRDNWATFEKSDFEDTVKKKSTDNFNDNENSPFSSDGKEEMREIPFHWHENTFRNRRKKDIPWQDDDESWDDYSPKESFCSDESSHEDRSPEMGREEHYEKPWNTCGRLLKNERMWNEKSGQWNSREKWQDETEDEFEESWRKQRERTSSYETDRKNNFWHNNYEGYHNKYEWRNSRSEPWDETERRLHSYVNRRKRSESDNEYRKRCDSDASDKECVWTFQKNYSDSHGRSGKQKQYHGSGPSFRDYPEYCHESRPKHRKGVPQKRPSSASESKRNYEKMFSSGDYSCRSSEKTYSGKRELDNVEYTRYQSGGKDFRHRGPDFPHYYSSYDRKMSGYHSKSGNRSSRGSSSGQSEMFLPGSKREETSNVKTHEFGYFEPFKEKCYKSGKPESHFQFDRGDDNFEKPNKTSLDQPQDFSQEEISKGNQWASANGKTNGDGFDYDLGRNNNDNFAKFTDDFKASPKKSKENGKSESNSHTESGKLQMKSKSHLVMLSRQESSTTLRKSDSINIFSRDKDPFEGDDFFSSVS